MCLVIDFNDLAVTFRKNQTNEHNYFDCYHFIEKHEDPVFVEKKMKILVTLLKV